MRVVRSPYALCVRLMRRMRIVRDQRGVSAVEFALILPTMIVLYLGIAEVGNAITVYRRVSEVASTAADLTAQVKTVSTADLGDIVSAAGAILSPYSTQPLKIVLSSVVADQNNNGKVAWSYSNKGAGRAANSAYPVPAGLTEANSSVIVAEVTYSYTPLVDLKSFFSPGPFDIKRTQATGNAFYARPRKSLTVTKTN
jgi:Flp pilus assembly protein TadG